MESPRPVASPQPMHGPAAARGVAAAYGVGVAGNIAVAPRNRRSPWRRHNLEPGALVERCLSKLSTFELVQSGFARA